MIKNSDGTPYTLGGSLNTFDPQNPDLTLLDDLFLESLQINGVPVLIYPVLIQMTSFDKLYAEDRSKLWAQIPTELNAFMEPVTNQNYQNVFGIDSPGDIVMEFSRKQLMEKLNGLPKVGSRIFVPFRRENFIVVQRNMGAMRAWHTVSIQIVAQHFQTSSTDASGTPSANTKTNTDIQID